VSRNVTADKKKLLIKLAKLPIVEIACKQVAVPRSTYYRWRKDDPDFAEACDEAIEHSSDLVNDMAESQLIASIKDKSMPAITFWLKHHHRAYATRVEVNAHVDTVQDELTPEQVSVVREALRLAGLAEQDEQEQ
jgi:Helix-turn-helix of insertion element transposase